MKRYHIIRKFMSEKTFCVSITLIVLLIMIYTLSGCLSGAGIGAGIGAPKELRYSRVAEWNYTETLTLFPDGQWVGVFYEDRYFPQISLSGAYRSTDKEIILTTVKGSAIVFTKNGTNIIFEGQTWSPN